jgi:hypothetical protein
VGRESHGVPHWASRHTGSPVRSGFHCLERYGQAVYLGKHPSATQPSKLINNGAGAALSLLVQDGQPPMKVKDGQVSTFNSTRGDDKIGVITNSPSGAPADRGFQIAVFC